MHLRRAARGQESGGAWALQVPNPVDHAAPLLRPPGPPARQRSGDTSGCGTPAVADVGTFPVADVELAASEAVAASLSSSSPPLTLDPEPSASSSLESDSDSDSDSDSELED